MATFSEGNCRCLKLIYFSSDCRDFFSFFSQKLPFEKEGKQIRQRKMQVFGYLFEDNTGRHEKSVPLILIQQCSLETCCHKNKMLFLHI